MNYKTNRLNHDFQIIYFIAGSCHTADGAYAILCDLKEDRENALKMFEANQFRERARRLRAESRLKDEREDIRLEAQAELAEIEALAETARKNHKGAIAELETIERCMQALQSQRRYKYLPEDKAHEAAQEEEWKLELIERAANYLITTGTIPTDHFATMRLHPAFQKEIWPAINEIRSLLQRPGGSEELIERISNRQAQFYQLMEPPTSEKD